MSVDTSIDAQFTTPKPISVAERQALIMPIQDIPVIRVDRGDTIPPHVWDFWDGVTAPTIEDYFTQRIDAIKVAAGNAQKQFDGPDAQYKMSIMDRIDHWFIAKEYRVWTNYKQQYEQGNPEPLRNQLAANITSATEDIATIEKALAQPMDDDPTYEQLASHLRSVQQQLDVATNADEIVLLTQQKAEVQKHLANTKRDIANANLQGKLTYLADMRRLLGQLPPQTNVIAFPTPSFDTPPDETIVSAQNQDLPNAA